MELKCSSLGSCLRRNSRVRLVPPPVTNSKFLFRIAAVSYKEFVNSALDETTRHLVLHPSPVQEKYDRISAIDGKTELEMLAFKSPSIRLLRSMSIENETMKVLDFAGFMEPEFDIPIFCANFFSSANMNIVVLDLNPLHPMSGQSDYKEKYYTNLMPLYHKYAELFPWGGKLTGESIKFFSPLVLWTKFTTTEERHRALFSAFLDYYKVWLEMAGQASKEMSPSRVTANREAQHKYLTWRTEKDPGHRVLRRLLGEIPAKDLLRNFLFNGVDELGAQTFLDYFPEYRTDQGDVSEQRSIIGRSYESRPWDLTGEFIG